MHTKKTLKRKRIKKNIYNDKKGVKLNKNKDKKLFKLKNMIIKKDPN